MNRLLFCITFAVFTFCEPLLADAGSSTEKLVKDALQLESREVRESAIEALKKGLADKDAAVRRDHLSAFMKVGEVEFDKKAFRPLILPFLDEKDGKVVVQAFYALYACGRVPADLERLLKMAKNPVPGMRDSLSHLLFSFAEGDLTQEAGQAVVGLLADGQDPREVLRGIWGAKFSPELEARVIALSKNADGSTNHDANYYALSTQANKSEKSIKRLIEILADPDVINISGRAAWGLQQGVAKEHHSLVAAAALNVVEARAAGYLRDNALRLVKAYATPANAEAIAALLAKPNLNASVHQALEAVQVKLDLKH